jgi:hypothetical protein
VFKESSRLVEAEDAHLGSCGLGDRDARGGIAAEKAPTYGLFERGVKNSVGVANCPRREFFLVHLVKHRLEIERREVAKSSFAEYRPDIPIEQKCVVREGLGSQLRPGSELKPTVKVLVEGQVHTIEFPALVALGQARIEVMSCGAEGAV